MIGSLIFLGVMGSAIFKMVYDYQLVKERLKMIEYGIEKGKEEEVEEPVSRKSSSRKPRGKNAGK